MKKLDKKPKKDSFAHWYGLDTANLMTVLVVGNPESALKELRKGKLCKTADDVQILRDMLTEQTACYHPPHLRSMCNRTGNTLFNEESGVSVMWFPVVPEDQTLVHETLHCVQNIMQSTGIHDDEFAAYTLGNLFSHYQKHLKEDQEKYEFTPSQKFV